MPPGAVITGRMLPPPRVSDDRGSPHRGAATHHGPVQAPRREQPHAGWLRTTARAPGDDTAGVIEFQDHQGTRGDTLSQTRRPMRVTRIPWRALTRDHGTDVPVHAESPPITERDTGRWTITPGAATGADRPHAPTGSHPRVPDGTPAQTDASAHAGLPPPTDATADRPPASANRSPRARDGTPRTPTPARPTDPRPRARHRIRTPARSAHPPQAHPHGQHCPTERKRS